MVGMFAIAGWKVGEMRVAMGIVIRMRAISAS
jgi:hypothetical protein